MTMNFRFKLKSGYKSKIGISSKFCYKGCIWKRIQNLISYFQKAKEWFLKKIKTIYFKDHLKGWKKVNYKDE
jgi:hypothetical protein